MIKKFGTLAAAGTLLLLTSCGGNKLQLPPQQDVKALVSQTAFNVSNLAASYSAIAPQLATVKGLSPDAVAKINQAIEDLHKLALSLANAATSAQAQNILQAVEVDVNAVVDTAATLPLPASISQPLAGGAILLPIVEAALNQLVAQEQAAVQADLAKPAPATPAPVVSAPTPAPAPAVTK